MRCGLSNPRDLDYVGESHAPRCSRSDSTSENREQAGDVAVFADLPRLFADFAFKFQCFVTNSSLSELRLQSACRADTDFRLDKFRY